MPIQTKLTANFYYEAQKYFDGSGLNIMDVVVVDTQGEHHFDVDLHQQPGTVELNYTFQNSEPVQVYAKSKVTEFDLTKDYSQKHICRKVSTSIENPSVQLDVEGVFTLCNMNFIVDSSLFDDVNKKVPLVTFKDSTFFVKGDFTFDGDNVVFSGLQTGEFSLPPYIHGLKTPEYPCIVGPLMVVQDGTYSMGKITVTAGDRTWNATPANQSVSIQRISNSTEWGEYKELLAISVLPQNELKGIKRRIHGKGIQYKIGNQDISFGNIIPKNNSDFNQQTPSRTDWQINDGWEVDIISPRKIAIKKFKIDTWGLRQIIDKSYDDPCGIYNGMLVKVHGISYVNDNVICHTPGSDVPDGFTKAYGGTGGYNVYWYPGQFTSGNSLSGLCLQFGGGYNATENERDDGLTIGRHPWDVGTMSYTQDCISKACWSDCSYSAITIGIYGGTQNAPAWHDESTGAYRQYDISDHPIYIDLDTHDQDYGADPSTQEIWDAYQNGKNVYHKEKTVENCWMKYGFIESEYHPDDNPDRVGHYVYAMKLPQSVQNEGARIPQVTDFGRYFKWYSNTLHAEIGDVIFLKFQLIAKNTEFWEPIKKFFRENEINAQTIDNLFSGSNIDGEIEFYLRSEYGYMSAPNLISGTKLSKVSFYFRGKAAMTSCNNMFKSAGGLTQIYTDKPFYARDLSGMFEWCGDLQSYPNNLIDWSKRFSEYDEKPAVTAIRYAFEGSAIVEIPLFDPEKSFDDDYNTIRPSNFSEQAFNTGALKHIRCRLDMRCAHPSMSKSMFNCTNLESARIYGLNHGNWSLDGQTRDGIMHGNIPNLDDDSIAYLIDNLNDLVSTYDPESDPANVSDYAPNVQSASLYLPETFQGKITSEQISGAKTKGWTIYVGGTEAV